MTSTGPTPAVVLNWIQRTLPRAYSDVGDELEQASRSDTNITGLLLTGSLARRDALPGTDVDVRMIVRTSQQPVFDGSVRRGLLIERAASTEAAALDAGDLVRATFSLDSAMWQIIDSLWAANRLPTPPTARCCPTSATCPDRPASVRRSRHYSSVRRPNAHTAVGLIDWIRTDLSKSHTV